MIIAFLLAAATPGERPLPPVKVPDVTANFQGDDRPIKFDPACRVLTIATLAREPRCAARFAAGETATSLSVAAVTIGRERQNKEAALAAVERAVAREDHPAAHYLLGALLGNAEQFRPDYPRAVRHLTIAGDRGNPAAADLLAMLLEEGKGAPRDVPRAVKLYERAMAGGYAGAAARLATLYLQGRHLPRDDAYGRRLLAAAAAAGDPLAQRLATLAQVPSTNHQLFPSPEDAGVRTRAFGVFDNPAIPPAFGFDDAFQRVHYSPYDDAAVLAMLRRDFARLPTPYLYELARRTAATDSEGALSAYLLARTRMAYDASRCADAAALEAMSAWDRVALPSMGYLFNGTPAPELAAAARTALRQEATLPADTRPWWVCRSGMAAISRALGGKPGPLELKPAAEWPRLRAEARQLLEGLAALPR